MNARELLAAAAEWLGWQDEDLSFGRKIPQYRFKAEPRALVEYVRIGREVQRLNSEVATLKVARRFASQAMQDRRAQNEPQPADQAAARSAT